MIRKLAFWRLEREERRLGASLDYLRHIARGSLPAFLEFGAFTSLASHRRALPAEPYHVARLVSTMDEDCGTCIRIEVRLARESGVAGDLIQAVLSGRVETLPPGLADVFRYSRAVVVDKEAPTDLRQRLCDRYGEAGLVELALAIATCRVFPTTRRALGYDTRCEWIGL
jgi:hypothetical protein